MAEVQKAFEDPQAIQASGFHVGGVKYMTIRADEKSLIGKQGKTGVVVTKTKQALIIAHHPDTTTTQACTTTVENLGDYLVGVGY